MAKHEAPSTDKTAFNCPSCGAFAAQKWHKISLFEFEAGETPEIWTAENIDIPGETALARRMRFSELQAPVERVIAGEVLFAPVHYGPGGRGLMNLHASECCNCKRLAFWQSDRLIIPSSGGVPPANADLPDEIRADYNEAAAIVNQSPRGAMALLRLAVQKLCKHLGESGSNINNDIASLVVKGLNTRVQQALDVIRVIGNNAVHPGQIDLKDDRAAALTLFQLINIIADKTISEPNGIDSAFSSLPAEARDAISRRDKGKV